MAGVEGVEPSHTVPETAVLPLDDTPITYAINNTLNSLSASRYISVQTSFRQERFEIFSLVNVIFIMLLRLGEGLFMKMLHY